MCTKYCMASQFSQHSKSRGSPVAKNMFSSITVYCDLNCDIFFLHQFKAPAPTTPADESPCRIQTVFSVHFLLRKFCVTAEHSTEVWLELAHITQMPAVHSDSLHNFSPAVKFSFTHRPPGRIRQGGQKILQCIFKISHFFKIFQCLESI